MRLYIFLLGFVPVTKVVRLLIFMPCSGQPSGNSIPGVVGPFVNCWQISKV
jgi:hypothetical protein